MLLKTHNINVFEAELGDEQIQPIRTGGLALASPECQKFIQKMKSDLSSVKISGYSMHGSSKGISCKFDFLFRGNLIEEKVRLIDDDGEWFPQVPKSKIIQLDEDEEWLEITFELSMNMRLRDQFDAKGNHISAEDILFEKIKAAFQEELDQANQRLAYEIIQSYSLDSFKSEAFQAFEDKIREKIHKALGPFEKCGPEMLHRFVDEIFCKKIHES